MEEAQIYRVAAKRARELVAIMPEYRGDVVAEEMIARHLVYLVFHTNREKYLWLGLSPIVKNGIVFFEVGHNASHYFYIGIRDGKRFQMSVGPNGYDEKTDTEIIKEHVGEVNDWNGYCGHF
jgi:hypothetical protein